MTDGEVSTHIVKEAKELNNTVMQNTIDTPTYRKIHFAVMAIENGAKKMDIPASQMVTRLNNVGLIHKRLIRHYDMLHTQSLEYVADDIVETLRNWEARR